MTWNRSIGTVGRQALFGAWFGVWMAVCSCAALQPAGLPQLPEVRYPAGTRVPEPPQAAQPEAAAAAPVVQFPPEPLRLTIDKAILLTLENNTSLEVERITPAIRKTFETEEQGIFDPRLDARADAAKTDERLHAESGETRDRATDAFAARLALSRFFPTGTSVELSAESEEEAYSTESGGFYSTRLGMTVTQALLKGFGTDVNLARLRQAGLDTRMSAYELRGFVEALVAQVEKTYWNYGLALRRIEIYEESLNLARRQRSETETMIAVGRLAEAEMAAANAEVAAQEQGLINARSNLQTTRLQLLRLLNPAGPGLWERPITLVHEPSVPDVRLEAVSAYAELAGRLRPELNQARLGILHNDLELVVTRNGLLPVLDFFITLGKTGYADSFGGSAGHLGQDNYDLLAGVQLSYPFYNHAAGARHQRALLTRDQSAKALQNLSQLVAVDVRTAYLEVERTHQQIAASTATRRFTEESLRIETEKFRVGRSTNLLVAQAQRDLLVSRIAEVESVVNYLKALIDLYVSDGTLLLRRGVAAPGAEPVALPGRGGSF